MVRDDCGWKTMRRVFPAALCVTALAMTQAVPGQPAPPAPPEVPPADFFDDFPDAPRFFESNPGRGLVVDEFRRSDLTGDGVGDVLIPFVGRSESAPILGRVVVSSGWGVEAAPLATISGLELNDGFGHIAVGIPDTTGDGIDDLLIAAPTSSAVAANAGAVYLYSGGDFRLVRKFTGSAPEGLFGWSVTSGDINGDGLHDVIVGQIGANDVRPGEVFVFLSGPSVPGDPVTVTPSSAADFHLTGEPWDHFGFSLSSGQDVDGDGRHDLVVGAPTFDPGQPATPNAGRAVVYAGAQMTPLVAIHGNSENRRMGAAVLLIPDQTGDGKAELLVGEPGDFSAIVTPNPYRGRVHSFASAALLGGGVLHATSAAATLTSGLTDEVAFGHAIELTNDVNGDGIADVMVSSSVPELIDPADLTPEQIAQGVPYFRFEDRLHVRHGATNDALYHFLLKDGSGREIEVPYPGPVGDRRTPEQGSFRDIGDLNDDLRVDGPDLVLAIDAVQEHGSTNQLTRILQNYGLDIRALLDDCWPYIFGPDEPPYTTPGEFAKRCECLERLGAAGFLIEEDPDCNDVGADPGNGGGGNPGGQNCNDLPRETLADCEAYAYCVSDAEYEDAIGDVSEEINDALDRLQQKVDEFNQAHQATRIAFMRLDEAIDRATLQVRTPAERKMRRIRRHVVVAQIVGPGATLVAGALGGPIALVATGAAAITGAAMVTDQANDEIQEIHAHMQSDLDVLWLTRADPNNSVQRPIDVDPTLWNQINHHAQGLRPLAFTAHAAWLPVRATFEQAISNLMAELDALFGELANLLQQRDSRRQQERAACIESLENPAP